MGLVGVLVRKWGIEFSVDKVSSGFLLLNDMGDS